MVAEDSRWEGREPEVDTLEGDEPEPEVGRRADVGRQFLETPIRELRPKAPVTVAEDTSVSRALEIMRKKRIGAVMVVSRRRPRRLVGILTDRDVLDKVMTRSGAGRLRVSKVMTPDPEALRPQDSCAFALNKMSVGRFRHIPLVDGDHVPVGILSVRDVVDFLVELIPEEVLNLPPEPQARYVKTQEGD
jgi:CBS domain-containing protein